MALYLSGKTKRKEFDEVYCDFSDLRVSVPATKIRRLNAELPSIPNNQESFINSVLRSDMHDEEMSTPMDGSSGLTEPASPSALNEERAIVMYRPSDAHMASFKINRKLIHGLKNYTFWPRNPNMPIEEKSCEESESSGAKKSLAMVP